MISTGDSVVNAADAEVLCGFIMTEMTELRADELETVIFALLAACAPAAVACVLQTLWVRLLKAGSSSTQYTRTQRLGSVLHGVVCGGPPGPYSPFKPPRFQQLMVAADGDEAVVTLVRTGLAQQIPVWLRAPPTSETVVMELVSLLHTPVLNQEETEWVLNNVSGFKFVSSIDTVHAAVPAVLCCIGRFGFAKVERALSDALRQLLHTAAQLPMGDIVSAFSCVFGTVANAQTSNFSQEWFESAIMESLVPCYAAEDILLLCEPVESLRVALVKLAKGFTEVGAHGRRAAVSSIMSVG